MVIIATIEWLRSRFHKTYCKARSSNHES